jgi:cytochrome c1
MFKNRTIKGVIIMTRFTLGLYRIASRNWRLIVKLFCAGLLINVVILGIGKTYQKWDRHPDRGAIGIESGALGESYSTPIYLNQGWSKSDTLWFYNITQGSALLPYDFFLVLEQAESSELLRSNKNIDKYRYLPQTASFFNPDALPVGFVKDQYQGKDYMGYSCAACHTGQVNYKGKAIRIDGGPAMADMVGFLAALEKSLKASRDDSTKRDRFVKAVLALNNDYSDQDSVLKDLSKWTDSIEHYNTINHSHIDYGYARLDAFGRIYNRVLQHVINKDQLRLVLLQVTNSAKQHILTQAQVDKVLNGISETIIGDNQFIVVSKRLSSNEAGYPGLAEQDMLRIRNAIFNEPDAPVSYPFLWDITHSDYVQWNAIAANEGVGPLGRNAGEVIGVFAILEWSAHKPLFSLSSFITGQDRKRQQINFKSSIDLTNLSRIEAHLQTLNSPQWPEEIFGVIDQDKKNRGQLLYNQYCQSCHQVIRRDDWNRLVTSNMSSIDIVGTDPAMASNSVNYSGYAGNFTSAYQKTGVGDVVIQNRAPVAQVLTAVTMGAVVTPDPDKWMIRRGADWAYMLAKSFFDNTIKPSVKSGNYKPDTTANPYQSLLSYKARSLNGVWATAPFLHNGSIPNLYSVLLPKKREGDPDEGKYRPDTFLVGSREFDPVSVGFRVDGYDGFQFQTMRVGDQNIGHEYGTGRDGKDPLTDQDRWDLIEYLKTL